MRKYSIFLFSLLVILLFSSVVSASSDVSSDNSTSMISEDTDDLTVEENSVVKNDYDEDSLVKDANNSKRKTTTKVNPSSNGSHIILNASVKSSKKVNEGFVIFKLDGSTLKKNNKTMKVNVVNSSATLLLSVKNYKKIYSTCDAIYSGSAVFNQSRVSVKTGFNVYETNTLLRTYVKGSNLIMRARVNSSISVNDGYVIYKLNQRTLRDSKNKNFKVNVVNSKAVLTLPLSEYRYCYSNSEAVYSGGVFYSASRVFLNKTLNNKLTPDIKIVTNQSSYYPGESVKVKVILSHEETNKFTGKASVKLNGVTYNIKCNPSFEIKGDSLSIPVTLPKGLKNNIVNISVVTVGNNYNKVEASKNVKLLPLSTQIVVDKFYVDNNNYCIVKANIFDKDGEKTIGKRFMDFLVDGQKLRINNTSKVYSIVNGKIDLKVPLDHYSRGNHILQLKLRNDSAYSSSSSDVYKINLVDKYYTKVIIDTPAKARNASQTSLRVYVTYSDESVLKTVNQGNVTVKINGKTLNSNVKYGKAVISCKLPSKVGTYEIHADYMGSGNLRDSSSTKNIVLTSAAISSADSVILGNKNPENDRIALIGGVPNLVYMTNYVWADEDGRYTLTKSQIEEVFRQDSYSLYLNKHLSKYVAFKTVDEPNVYHVLRRQKWNVIEKAVNNIRVKTSKGTVPSEITVNLKGKEYTYGEVRAIQSTEYTCGPTATSVCTMALRNYVNEYTLAVDFNTYKYRGTYAKYIPSSMKKHDMSAVYYYKSNFNTVLNKLASGGCAFVFYGVNHYVSIIDISKDKSKVLVSNSYGNYELGGGKIPNGWVSVSTMKNKFSKDSFAGLLVTLDYNLSKSTQTSVNNLYNNFVSGYARKDTSEELKV